MKSSSRLYDLYYEGLYETIIQLEKERKDILGKIKLFLYIFVLFEILLIVWAFKRGDFEYPAVFFMLGIFAIGLLYDFLSKDYKNSFKTKIVKGLIKGIDPGLIYDPKGCFPFALYRASALFEERVDRYRCQDLVYGEIDGVKIMFSDLQTWQKRRDSKGNEYWHPIFKGVFFCADFHKSFKGVTLVYPERIPFFADVTDGLRQVLKRGSLEPVRLDSPEFEKSFTVYSTDQIEARYILSHSMMERILKFRSQIKRDLYLSFKDGKIFLAIEGLDNFEPPLFRSLLKFEVAKEYINSLKFTLGAVEELKLNIRIWSRV